VCVHVSVCVCVCVWVLTPSPRHSPRQSPCRHFPHITGNHVLDATSSSVQNDIFNIYPLHKILFVIIFSQFCNYSSVICSGWMCILFAHVFVILHDIPCGQLHPEHFSRTVPLRNSLHSSRGHVPAQTVCPQLPAEHCSPHAAHSQSVCGFRLMYALVKYQILIAQTSSSLINAIQTVRVILTTTSVCCKH